MPSPRLTIALAAVLAASWTFAPNAARAQQQPTPNPAQPGGPGGPVDRPDGVAAQALKEKDLLPTVPELPPERSRKRAFELLELISMLTYGEDECRAWPVRRGTPAPRAAGKIHSDIERGFIRVEVVRWEDLTSLGSEAKCKEAGVYRVEGKEYIIADGDAVHFRFNV